MVSFFTKFQIRDILTLLMCADCSTDTKTERDGQKVPVFVWVGKLFLWGSTFFGGRGLATSLCTFIYVISGPIRGLKNIGSVQHLTNWHCDYKTDPAQKTESLKMRLTFLDNWLISHFCLIKNFFFPAVKQNLGQLFFLFAKYTSFFAR